MTFQEWLVKNKQRDFDDLSLQEHARFYAEYVTENTDDPVAAWTGEWHDIDYDTCSDTQKEFLKDEYIRARTSDFKRLAELSFSDWKELYCPIPVSDKLVSYDIERVYKSFGKAAIAIPPITFAKWLDLHYSLSVDDYRQLLNSDSKKISYVYCYVEHLGAYLSTWRQAETEIYFALMGDTHKLHYWVVREYGLPDKDYGRPHVHEGSLAHSVTTDMPEIVPVCS